jgi:hypothetical protein
MAHPPDDFSAMFQEEIDRHADPRGILPIPLANARYAQLDTLVKQRLADEGIDRCTIEQYRAALREVIDELLTPSRAVSPRLPVTGSDLSDRAEKLLVSRGTSTKDATLSQYMDALDAARASLEDEEDQLKLRALAIRMERASGGKLRIR